MRKKCLDRGMGVWPVLGIFAILSIVKSFFCMSAVPEERIV